MKRLVAFEWECGRQGTLSGQFVTTEEEWAQLEELISNETEIHFGEVLGKHSEISGEIDRADLIVVTKDQDWLNKAEELGIDLDTGYNPLDYVDRE